MRMIALWIILISAIPHFLVQDPPEDNAVAAILALEHEWVDGQSRNDNRALDLLFDNALVYVEDGVLMTKGQYLSRIRAGGPAAPQIVMEPMTVHVSGKVAIVVGTYRQKSTINGRTSLGRWRFVDTWVDKKGHWMLVAAASAPLLK